MPEPDPTVTNILVAGGVGAPPLYFLAQQMRSKGNGDCRVAVVNGARTRSLLVAVKEFESLGIDLSCTTDDGSHGVQGLVIDRLRELLFEVNNRASVYSCGPTPMLKAVSKVCLEENIPCQLSVETLMPCGLGVCMACVVKIRDEFSPEGYVYKRSCQDGPVFTANVIIWD